jgi:hypothetical protein
MLNQAMTMMHQVMMMNLVEMTQWNNGGPFLDSDGLGIAAVRKRFRLFSGQTVEAKLESSNDRHIIQPAPAEGALTNSPVNPICMDGDEVMLTPYQCLVREHIELFEAGAFDIRGTAQGRNTRILLGQAGVRYRHCADLPTIARARGVPSCPEYEQGTSSCVR